MKFLSNDLGVSHGNFAVVTIFVSYVDGKTIVEPAILLWLWKRLLQLCK